MKNCFLIKSELKIAKIEQKRCYQTGRLWGFVVEIRQSRLYEKESYLGV